MTGHLLTQLIPNTLYDIRLVAQNSNGLGAPTSIISVKTLADGKSLYIDYVYILWHTLAYGMYIPEYMFSIE